MSQLATLTILLIFTIVSNSRSSRRSARVDSRGGSEIKPSDNTYKKYRNFGGKGKKGMNSVPESSDSDNLLTGADSFDYVDFHKQEDKKIYKDWYLYLGTGLGFMFVLCFLSFVRRCREEREMYSRCHH